VDGPVLIMPRGVDDDRLLPAGVLGPILQGMGAAPALPKLGEVTRS
jgi:hypothetical protein